MILRIFAWMLAGACLFAAGAVPAAEETNAPFDISTPESFQQQAAAVRAGLQPGGTYSFLAAQERAAVEEQIDRMDNLLKRYGSIETMSGADRVRLFNAQETADRILTRGRAGMVKCAWGPITGSHIPRTMCWQLGAI